MVVVTATVYVCTSQAIFAAFGCTFALYPFVAMAMQFITLPGLVLPAKWTVRQSTRDSSCLYYYNIVLNKATLVPPPSAPTARASIITILWLRKIVRGSIGHIHCPVLLGRRCMCVRRSFLLHFCVFYRWGLDGGHRMMSTLVREPHSLKVVHNAGLIRSVFEHLL